MGMIDISNLEKEIKELTDNCVDKMEYSANMQMEVIDTQKDIRLLNEKISKTQCKLDELKKKSINMIEDNNPDDKPRIIIP